MGTKTVYKFADAINEHNVEMIYGLMADGHTFIDAHGHTFIDAHGNVVVGKDKMKAGWAGYFQWFPDYTIEIEAFFEKDNTVAAFGFASGTFKGFATNDNENYWRLPAAFKAIVEGDTIKLWQVYCDTKIPFDIISRNK